MPYKCAQARSIQWASAGAVKRSCGECQKAGSGRERASIFKATFEIKVWYFRCVLSSFQSAQCLLWVPSSTSGQDHCCLKKETSMGCLKRCTELCSELFYRVNVLGCRNRCTANSGWIVHNLWQVLKGNSLTVPGLYKQLNKVCLVPQL